MVGPYADPQLLEHRQQQYQGSNSSSVTLPNIDSFFAGDNLFPEDTDIHKEFDSSSFALHPLKPAHPLPLNHATLNLPSHDPFLHDLPACPPYPTPPPPQPDPAPQDPCPSTTTTAYHTTNSLRQQLQQAACERDEARMVVSALRNEVYAARQAEKRLRAERDDARGQVLFLRREGRLAEWRLRRERNEMRTAAAVVGRAKRRKGIGESP
ncbi:hypothetical protein B0H67DRAFT_680407 [Lasiosphaeris hirsuta]|uniref:Uncharacterized protein n=1 Tax=Lasiosphaeris hirsuta TaxID=260670 RepID=A0AA40AZP6_9PEZI|nr:hypothetical protein B0H67DRAFT_680407 [Lasiosphaeris hirsuta]